MSKHHLHQKCRLGSKEQPHHLEDSEEGDKVDCISLEEDKVLVVVEEEGLNKAEATEEDIIREVEIV